MAASNFARCCALTLKHEGGYVDHPADPGGATNLGVTIGTLSAWLGRPATKADVRALTREAVAPIYRKNYWNAIRGDDLPTGVDQVIYDFAVNSGAKRGAIGLQRALGLADDGVIGPRTVAAAALLPAETIINRACDQRLAFLRQLSTWPTFGNGWTTRVQGVRREALAMARTAPASAVASITITNGQTASRPVEPARPVAPGPTIRTGGLWPALRGIFTRKAS